MSFARANKKSKWSNEDEQKLFKLAKDSTPMTEVYASFPNKTQSAIHNKITRMYYSRNKDTLTIQKG